MVLRSHLFWGNIVHISLQLLFSLFYNFMSLVVDTQPLWFLTVASELQKSYLSFLKIPASDIHFVNMQSLMSKHPSLS